MNVVRLHSRRYPLTRCQHRSVGRSDRESNRYRLVDDTSAGTSNEEASVRAVAGQANVTPRIVTKHNAPIRRLDERDLPYCMTTRTNCQLDRKVVESSRLTEKY